MKDQNQIDKFNTRYPPLERSELLACFKPTPKVKLDVIAKTAAFAESNATRVLELHRMMRAAY